MHKKRENNLRCFLLRAENETRTRDPNLGKVMLYQLRKELFSWCPEQDSNLHASRHTHLKRARLPFRHLGITVFRPSRNKRLSGKRDSNSRP
jgi:hypothetical protein